MPTHISTPGNQEANVFRCDLLAPSSLLKHAWEHTIGSGHAPLALRADYQRQLAQCHRDLGFKHVRFHGLLSDDMGTFIINCDEPLYSFFNIDQVFDFLLSIGMRPFVELSFMPTGLSSGDKIVFHYRANVTPPRDYEKWKTLIQKLTSHWVERYGVEEVRQWFFEVWNEPNLDYFWDGKQEDYFKLYQTTAEAVKSVDEHLRVGGPATAGNAWIVDFLNFCKANKVPADFVSTHHYPTDAFGKPGDDTEAQLAASRRSVMREQAQTAFNEAAGTPLYYTEWSSSSNPRDTLHDQPYAAAFAVKTVMENNGLVEAYSYWTFSDIFEENYFPSVPFHGGFGLMNLHGIPKPIYRAYELLASVGDKLIPVSGAHPTVDVWIVQGRDTTAVIVTNHALPRHPVTTETVRVEIKNIAALVRATISRVDDNHSNPQRAWHDMGEPNYLTHAQVAELQEVSKLTTEPQSFECNDNVVSLSIVIPPQGVAVVKLFGITATAMHA